jgi:hypothetical protein
LNLSREDREEEFSSIKGANRYEPKSRERLDSQLKIEVGREILKILVPVKTLLIIYLITPVCCYSFS